MLVHLLEGARGCEEAVERGAIAILVDALRTSATLPFIFDKGAAEVLVARDLVAAQALGEAHPDALLAGELGGKRIAGFDLGNSPEELLALDARALFGRTVIFTSSAGSQRLIEASGAPELLVGSPVNARRVALHAVGRARESGRDIAVIAAGHPERGVATPEDQLAAAFLISLMPAELAPEGRAAFDKALDQVVGSDLGKLFRQSPNAKRLSKLGFGADVGLAATPNLARSIPEKHEAIDTPDGGRALRLVRAEPSALWLHLAVGLR